MKDKVRFYNKEMYQLEENIKTLILILIIFCLGVFVGYFTSNKCENKREKDINNITIEQKERGNQKKLRHD